METYTEPIFDQQLESARSFKRPRELNQREISTSVRELQRTARATPRRSLYITRHDALTSSIRTTAEQARHASP